MTEKAQLNGAKRCRGTAKLSIIRALLWIRSRRARAAARAPRASFLKSFWGITVPRALGAAGQHEIKARPRIESETGLTVAPVIRPAVALRTHRGEARSNDYHVLQHRHHADDADITAEGATLIAAVA